MAAKKIETKKKARPCRAGDLVVVEHGSTKRGQVAVVVVVREGLLGVRKYSPTSGDFGEQVDVPTWKVKGKPERSDERATATRALIKAMAERGEKL